MIFESEEFLDSDFAENLNLDEHLRKLNELKNFNFSNFTQKEIEVIFERYLKVIPLLTAFFDKENFNKFQFYRVRLNIDDSVESIFLSRTYSYPLPQFCKTNGRANLKNKSVFYCTNSPITAILESKPKIGDIGYLSIWEGNADRKVKGGVLLPEELKQTNPWQFLAKDIYKEVYKDYATVPKSEFYLATINFIADLFITEKEPYHITSHIADNLIYGEKWKDFIVYPSFVHDGHSCNMAFHPNIADKFLKFQKVIRFKLLDIQGDKHVYSTGRVGEILNTNITWRYANDNELDFLKLPT